MGMFDKVKETAASLATKAGELTNVGLEKLKETVDEILAATPQLKAIGYRLTDLELQLSIPPRAIVFLLKEFDAPEEAFTGSLRDNSNNRTFCTVVKMLQQVDYVQGKIQVKDRKFKELAIDLGLPPAVRLKYTEPVGTPASQEPIVNTNS